MFKRLTYQLLGSTGTLAALVAVLEAGRKWS
jgi:hypothetical protein